MSSNNIYLNVDEVKQNLGSKTVRGSKYAFLFQGLRFPIFFIGNVILARILEPEHFGLIAMVATALNFTSVFANLGISQAVIQEENLSELQLSSLFWINVLTGLLLCGVLGGGSYLVAEFYDESRLIPIMLVLALTFVFGGSYVLPTALLKRAMMNHLIFRIQVLTVVLKFGIAITFAYIFESYWALVFLRLGDPIFTFFFTWHYCKWRPKFQFDFKSIKGLLGFGINISLSNIIRYFARYSPSIFVGRLYDTAILGYFATAYNLVLFPIFQINLPLKGVFVPALTRIKDNAVRFRRYYISLLQFLNLIIGVNIFFGIYFAQEIFLTVLGEKWIHSASIFQALGVAAILQPMINSFEWIFISMGMGRKAVTWQLIAGVATILSVIVMLPYGIQKIAISYSIFELAVKMPIGLYLVTKCSSVRIKDFLLIFVDLVLMLSILSAFFYSFEFLLKNADSALRLIFYFTLTNITILGFMLFRKNHRQLILKVIRKKSN